VEITFKWVPDKKSPLTPFYFLVARSESNSDFVELQEKVDFSSGSKDPTKDEYTFIFTDGEVKSGIRYRYSIRAYIEAGSTSDYTVPVEITVGGDGDGDCNGLRAPTDVVAQIVNGCPPVNIGWKFNGNLDVVDGFLVQRGINGGEFKDLATVPKTATSYVDSDIEDKDGTYVYRVGAFCRGEKMFSEAIVVVLTCGSEITQQSPQTPTSGGASTHSGRKAKGICSNSVQGFNNNSPLLASASAALLLLSLFVIRSLELKGSRLVSHGGCRTSRIKKAAQK
jgi:hypothetical protein